MFLQRKCIFMYGLLLLCLSLKYLILPKTLYVPNYKAFINIPYQKVDPHRLIYITDHMYAVGRPCEVDHTNRRDCMKKVFHSSSVSFKFDISLHVGCIINAELKIKVFIDTK